MRFFKSILIIVLVLGLAFTYACENQMAKKTGGQPVMEMVKASPAMMPLAAQTGAAAPPPPPEGEPGPRPDFNTESYDRIYDNPFLRVRTNPLSTFGVDVDTASYSNVRRFLRDGEMPPPDAVRIEEMVNYFDYAYEPPKGDEPFAVHTTVADCPWKKDHKLLRIGVKAKEMEQKERPPSNIVLLLDVSGSMESANKLPLLRRAMKLLVRRLNDTDRVAIVVYAGASGLVLPSTACSPENAVKIVNALDQLQAGGSTHGSAGIELAYKTAAENFMENGVNRVILATDGDFNVGVSSQGDLVRLIEEKAKSGIFLTVLGFGMGNLKDSTMEKLADKGNGVYGYIDSIMEARKILVEQMSGTLVTVAKDVKIQIEFNPAEIKAYRLIGYENRLLRAEDFNDDKKDAGDIGAGHTVTALYELVPVGVEIDLPKVDDLKYQEKKAPAGKAGELMTIKLRYKEPDGQTSKLITRPVAKEFGPMDEDFRFAASAASFGMLLRDSKYKGEATYESVIEMALSGKGKDEYGYRAEFINLVRNARELSLP